jgi:vitamin B12 transporter
MATAIVLGWSFAACAQAQDSTAAITLDEVEVFGEKTAQFAVGSRITNIDSITIRNFNAGSLADILQMRSPLHIKSYGQGMLSTVSFRGTGAEHTAVIWNGFNINLPTLGQTDFASIPLSTSASIDIQHGNAGSLYGTGAIGGAVILNNTLNWSKGWQVNLQQDMGSFNTYFSNVQGRYSTGRLLLQTQLYRLSANNDFVLYSPKYKGTNRLFDFRPDEQPHGRLQNTAVVQQGIRQDVGLKLSDRTQLSASGWFSRNNRQIQASWGAAHNNARQEDENLRLSAEIDHSSAVGKTAIRGAFFNDILNYSSNVVYSGSRVQTWQSQAEHEVILENKLKVKAGAELQHFVAHVKSYGGIITENRASAFLHTRYNPFEKLELSLNMRQALVQGYNPPFTPSVAVNIYVLQHEKHKLSLKANASKGYRVPTLNERFWQPGGNPNIKPESSMSYESGLVYSFTASQVKFNTELSGYTMQVHNWIQWQPQQAGYWAPVNLLQVHSRGIEYSNKLSYTGKNYTASLGGTYAYSRATEEKGLLGQEVKQDKQLYYVPQHTGGVWTELNYRQWFGNVNVRYTGSRLVAGPREVLKPFTLVNLAVGRNIKIYSTQLQLIAKVNNLMNHIYENMENMAMPPRSYSISLRLNINK